MVHTMSELAALRDEHSGKSCTLNGQSAVVTRAENGFAKIVRLSDGLSVEFSWEAVDRVMSATRKKERGAFNAS